MTYPIKIQEFIKEFNKNVENSENKAFFEAESGDFFGFGYASPFEFVTEVNKYLEEVSFNLKPEDRFLPEDAKKRWALSVDTEQPDSVCLWADKVTERTPHAFQVYWIST